MANRSTQLKREMSGFGGMVLGLTNMSPSIGIFIAAPVVIQQSGTFAIMACVLAALLGLVIGGLYAELASALPHTGGEYVLLGETLGPVARFAGLSLALTVIPVALALSGLGTGDFLRAVWPGLPSLPIAISSVVAATAIASLSIRLNAWITGAFVALELAAMGATAALGVLHPHHDLIQVVLHPVSAAAGGGLKATPLLAMGLSGAAAAYVLTGYNAPIFFSEEIVGARRKMIWMVYGALGLGALAMLPALMAVIVGSRDLARLTSSATPIQDFLLEAGGPGVAAVINVSVALAVFNAMIAIALIGGRILFSSARENVWPGGLNRLLRSVHPRLASPWIATPTVGAVGALLCLAPLPVLVLIAGNGTSVGYGLLSLAVIAGRRNGSTLRSQARMAFHPLGPALVLLASVGLIVAGLAEEGPGRAGVLATLAILGAGALYYLLALRPAGRWAPYALEEEGDAAVPGAPRPAGERDGLLMAGVGRVHAAELNR